MYCISDSTGADYYIDLGRGNEKLLERYKIYKTHYGFDFCREFIPCPYDYEIFFLDVDTIKYIDYPDPILDLQEKTFDILGDNFVLFMKELNIPLHNDLSYLSLTVM